MTKSARFLISLFLGLFVSYAVFLAWILVEIVSLEAWSSWSFLHKPVFYNILFTVFYCSVIAFLIGWNKKSRFPKIPLILTGLCLFAFAAVSGRAMYIRGIPVVSEREDAAFLYRPFHAQNILAKLEGASSLKLEAGLPRLDGATALRPVYAAFIQAVYSPAEYDRGGGRYFESSGTARAYENLTNGEADIIFCAAPSDEQREKAGEAGVVFELTAIGREAFVFFVNSKNPIDSLSVEDIRGVYSGQITNWKALGGRDEDIRAFQRPANSGSQTALEKIMGTAVPVKPAERNRVTGMGAIVEMTADYKNFRDAIGYSFLFFVTRMADSAKIKLLAIDGVAPSPRSIASGEYPFSDAFYAVTILGAETENTRKLLDWIVSPQGQELVEKTGYTPLPARISRR